MLDSVRIQLAAAALIVLTILSFSYVPRYELAGDQLLEAPQFFEAPSAWTLVGEERALEYGPSGVRLHGELGLARARQFVDTPEADALRLVATTRYVGNGDPFPGQVRILLLGHGARERWDLPFGSLEVELGTDFQRQQVEIRLEPTVKQYSVTVMNRGLPGSYEVANVSLYPLRERWPSRWLTRAIGVGWLLLGGACARILWGTPGSRWLRRLVWAGFGLIVLGVMIPKPRLVALSRWAHRSVTERFPLVGTLGDESHLLEHLQSVSHFGLFAFLALVLTRLWPESHLGRLTSTVVIFAASTEVIQWYTLDREPQFGDLYLDLAGAALGIFIGRISLQLWPVGGTKEVGIADDASANELS